MILYRYINRQLFMTTVVVTFVLTMVLVSGRFIKYMAQAAAGEIAADALFLIMLFRLPEFLQMILPLSVYIGILLVFGRMYVDNEMVVLRAGGIGPGRILRALFLPTLVTTALIALFSLYVTPMGDAQVNRIFEQQDERSVLELLSPGRFHAQGTGEGHRATYAESLDREEGELGNVFISDLRYGDQQDAEARMLTIWAETGRIIEWQGETYLELRQGRQYQGRPGQPDYQALGFERSLIRIGKDRKAPPPPEVRGRTTKELLRSDSREALAELQWRISLILLVPVMILVAVPLSKVSPRQGPFMRLVPALLLFMLYVGLLMVMRSWIADHRGPDLPWYLHMAWIHLIAVAVVALLYSWPLLSGRRAGA